MCYQLAVCSSTKFAHQWDFVRYTFSKKKDCVMWVAYMLRNDFSNSSIELFSILNLELSIVYSIGTYVLAPSVSLRTVFNLKCLWFFTIKFKKLLFSLTQTFTYLISDLLSSIDDHELIEIIEKQLLVVKLHLNLILKNWFLFLISLRTSIFEFASVSSCVSIVYATAELHWTSHYIGVK